jgi:hypothetical protein
MEQIMIQVRDKQKSTMLKELLTALNFVESVVTISPHGVLEREAEPTKTRLRSSEEIFCYGKQRQRELVAELGIAISDLSSRREDQLRWQIVREVAEMASGHLHGEQLIEVLDELEEILLLEVIIARDKAGKSEVISQEEDEALSTEKERMIRETRQRWPNGYEDKLVMEHRVFLWPLEDGWWLADVPKLEEFWLQGETKEEALELIEEELADVLR